MKDRSKGDDRGDSVGLPPAALAALEAGRKLDAVKSLRTQTGLALTEALERVEAYIASEPVLLAEFTRQRHAVRGRIRGLLLIAALLVVIAAWIVFG